MIEVLKNDFSPPAEKMQNYVIDHSKLEIEVLEYPHKNKVKIPEDIIQALKDMDHYESFCAFCYGVWKSNRNSKFKKISCTKLLDNYFNQIEQINQNGNESKIGV